MTNLDSLNPYNQRLHQEAVERDTELVALSQVVSVSELARQLKVSRSWLYHRIRRAKQRIQLDNSR